MKWYGIDEDIYLALVDLLGEARTAAETVGDEDSLTYYTFLLGELEEAKKFNGLGKGKPMDDEQTQRMMKLQRYLRMLHSGLKDPKDSNKKERRKIAREVIDPPKENPNKDIINKVSMKDVERFLKDDPELSEVDRFELYYEERERRVVKKNISESQSLNDMLDEIGIEPYNSNKKGK